METLHTAEPRAGPAHARTPAILAPGRNCWRIETATRAAFLVDGEEYFGAVRAALARAQRSIFIVGWDVDSRMQLAPGAHDGLPSELGPFLHALVRARRHLRTHVLSWDYAFLYALEREWWSASRLGNRSRIAVRLDDRHPLGASHHQKIVVIDDTVAFVSGFDLTGSRWDTSDHASEHPMRIDAQGRPYAPFHDVGAMVEGPVARALGELCRGRWRRASGREATLPSAETDASPWPAHVQPELRDVPVAISRTEPAYLDRHEVSEVRTLHLDAIAAAGRFVFAENQYFTSTIVAAAMAERLREPDPPEFVLIVPASESGWLETSTMGVLRARVHTGLREVDHANRYRMYCPRHPQGTGNACCINVHSKVLVVDDAFLTLGSANLSNRSMCLDTECNLAFEARGDPRVGAAIARLRARLMGEHLGEAPETLLDAPSGSLHEAIERRAHPERRHLHSIEPRVDPALEAIVPDHEVIDPDRALDPDVLTADLLPAPSTRRRVLSRVLVIAALAVLLGGLALAWRYTPLREVLSLSNLVTLGEQLREWPWAPLAVVAAFVASGFVAIPVTLMIAVTAAVYAPWVAIPLSLAGALASGATTFGVGRGLAHDVVRDLAGRRLTALSARLRRRGLLAVLIVRLLPVAPFSVVNVVAGASRIRWRDFLIGTALGLLPGVILTSAFVDRALAAAAAPSPRTLATLAAVLVAIVLCAFALRRRFGLRD